MLIVAEASSESSLVSEIEHAAHYLPAQGPIEVFVHHNTLHAFEHLPFHQAVRRAYELYGAQPYLREPEYRQLLVSGRVTSADLRAALEAALGNESSDVEWSLPEELFGSRFDLRLAMLQYPIHRAPARELRWVMAETDALTKFRLDVEPSLRDALLEEARSETRNASDAPSPRLQPSQLESLVLERLWSTCCRGVKRCVSSKQSANQPRQLRLRDTLLKLTNVDMDQIVHPILIPFTAAFLDQGYADTPLPGRDQGFLHAFISLYSGGNRWGEPWLVRLSEHLTRLQTAGRTALESIAQSLRAFGVSEGSREQFVVQTLLALPGWAGMVHQLEHAPSWVYRPAPKDSLVEFLAVRLVLEQVVAEWLAREHLEWTQPIAELNAAKEPEMNCMLNREDSDAEVQLAFEIFQIAQIMGWSPSALDQYMSGVIREITNFDEIARRALFQEAYERNYRHQALEAIRGNLQRSPASPGRPVFQLCTCIDDREESFRRHLEEVQPQCTTYGAAGFFAVAMYYRGIADASYKPLCPAPVTPRHYVKEDVGYTFSGEHARRAEARRRLGRWTHRVHSGSHTFVGGIVTSMLGSLAAFPLVARVLFPRLTSQLRRIAGRLVEPPQVTQLQLERYEDRPGPDAGHVGFNVPEMVEVVQRLLEDIGLTDNFARLCLIVGHGSSSVNNPHSSAYNCGACAGKRGGPNARAFAHMANDFRVRLALVDRGIRVPADTWFLGAYHNTCDDSLGWFDLDRMPPSHHQLFEETKKACDEAALRNAHERCRRFHSTRPNGSLQDALRHVEQRSEDLSQVRPEYNHATNALCLVGRREWSRGLFLDRRAFLTSYDPTQDDESGRILARILAAVIPVCAGISLEYYFSCVDSTRYGAGSKLPHNLVGLLGVMEGAASDLRTGLYQQMVEIHEPMRLLFVVETRPEIIAKIIDENPAIRQLCDGDWVQLVVLDTATEQLWQYQQGDFVAVLSQHLNLPSVPTSRDWYAGRRGCLGFARVERGA